MLPRDAKLGVQNTREMLLAETLLRDTTHRLNSVALPWPDGYPVPRLGLPNKGFAPDYFRFGSYSFGSRRLRDVMALPENVVQHVPIELISGGEAVRDQDYRLLRVVAMQPAVDLDRSECEIEERISLVTGQPFKIMKNVVRFVLLDGLQPRTEVFCIEEICSRILGVDAFAERVLRAGCTGGSSMRSTTCSPARAWNAIAPPTASPNGASVTSTEPHPGQYARKTRLHTRPRLALRLW
ncbi:imm11 family protein [Limobrevibacterium gyesilva]|nr:DUF1629 domain-containing protein [Limobrevibacterium gyesilva]